MRYNLTAETAGTPENTSQVLRVDPDSGSVGTYWLGVLDPTTVNFVILFAGLTADTILWAWVLIRILRLW
jgi:hypothetical protein